MRINSSPRLAPMNSQRVAVRPQQHRENGQSQCRQDPGMDANCSTARNGRFGLAFHLQTYLGFSEFMVYLVRVYLGSLPNPSHLWVAATLPAQLRTRSALVEHMQGTMLARA